VIRVSHLTKRYGAHTAVDDVSFEVGAGEVVGFLGPNGAGKSTTLRILAGFLGASAGTVTVAGHDLALESIEARRAIGYMPEAVPLYPEMRVAEYLRFRAELKGVSRARRRAYVDDALHLAAVVDVANKTIGHLSKGYRQRVGLADALVAKPPIVVLDEPTAGLDPNQIRDTRALVRALGREHTVVLSTHILSEVEACATRVLLLHKGRLVAEGATERIRAMRSPTALDVTIHGAATAAIDAVRVVDGVADVRSVPATSGDPRERIRIRFATPGGDGPAGGAGTDADARALATERCVAALVAKGIGVREVRAADGSLEDVFAALTQESDPVAPADRNAGSA
jgi:ABC-2 type transport system ATP-binding protein